MSVLMPAAIAGATEAARRVADERAARAALATLRPPNPIRPALVLAAGDVVNGTPTALIRWHGARRLALYPIPRPLQVGRLVFAQELGGGNGQLVIVATNYQVDPRTAALSSGSGLGYGPVLGAGGTVTPSADWAADMTDPANADGSLLPLTLGEGAR